jgi:hypothetical protein
MKKINVILISFALFVMGIVPSFAQEEKEFNAGKNWTPPQNYVIDTKTDCMGYWMRLAELGFIPIEKENPFIYTVFTGVGPTDDGTDIPVATGSGSQSENSGFVNPVASTTVLNSNNSLNPGFQGADYLISTNSGTTWGGSTNAAGGANSGDPAVGISSDGSRWYVNYINNASYGQSVAVSTNQGSTWTAYVAAVSTGMCDKNHFWIDVAAGSPYLNNLYVAYSNLGGAPNVNRIEFVRSTNGGLNWSGKLNISAGAGQGGSHEQGVNIQTGPNGEVYVVWSIYESWPSVETSIGFAKSTNGGANFSASSRIITNTKGIRGYIKGIRCNSFPSSACDISNSAYRGHLYVVWANMGVPGVNTGSDVDIYMIKSTNGGTNWGTPVKVIKDCTTGDGKVAWQPWITCDPVTGNLSCVFYDDRSSASGLVETWCANSSNGGATWNNFKVSDVAFTPAPIPGLASGYMGDYLGITARNGNVYPFWCDNRGGYWRTYTSPYVFGPAAEVSIAITSGTNPTCAGVNVTFTATPVNGGTTPAYQWQVNGANVGTNSPTYSSTTLANGDIVTCILTSNLAGVLGSPATSCPITMTVNPSGSPSVAIAITSGANPSCAGASVTFTATPTNGGTTPAYQWKVNGGNVGTNSPTYTTSILTNGQIVTCVLTSNAPCMITPTATSNAITMTINPIPATPTITRVGLQLTSSSATGNQWYLNGSPIPGATNQVYNVTQNGSYTVIVTINGCPSLPSAPVVIIDVGIYAYNNTYGLTIYPNPNEGIFKVNFKVGTKTNFKIEISDVLGNIVYTENLLDFSGDYTKNINLSAFGKGVYTLGLINAKNKTYKKVIVY